MNPGICGWRLTVTVFLASIISISPLRAQDIEEPVVITRIDMEIDGKTRFDALKNELRIREGKGFDSLEDLEVLLESRSASLNRRRLFAEFDWNLNSPEPGEAEVDIRIVDSFTLYPRPLIQYASDTGLLLGLKLEYYNAFGTLTDQIFEAYWSPGETKGRIDVSNFAIGPLHLDIAFEQFDGITRYGDPQGVTRVEFRNSHTLLSLMADWSLGAASSWSYRLEPQVIWQYNYRFVYSHPEFDDTLYINEGFSPGFVHGIFTDQVEWIGNLRQGFKFSLMNRNLWYLETDRCDSLLESDLFGYLPLTEWLEISGRLGGFLALEGWRSDAGDRLRGVVDYMTYGTWGAFITAQTNLRIIRRGGLFSLYMRPFVDVGYVKSEEWEQGPEAWEYCAGSTVIIFLDSLPGLNLNVEAGWDFKRRMSEVIINTSLLL